jgi:hypothetical protein
MERACSAREVRPNFAYTSDCVGASAVSMYTVLRWNTLCADEPFT